MPEIQSVSNYKKGIKGTSLFGGVQVFIIITGMIKTKIVAVLLGPDGMGFMGLLTSTVNLISTYTNCGLATSAVREIAASNSLRQDNKVSKTICALKRIIWFTGSAGALVCAILSPLWSYMCFNNYNYWGLFVILSISVLLTQLTLGRNAILQGLRKYRYMAHSNIKGNVVGLIFIIPLYYIWKMNAIVPCMIVASAIAFIWANYYSKKAFNNKIKLSNKEVFIEGKDMMKMGLFISFQGILSISCAYILRIFISNIGSVAEVGLYTAAFTVTNNYIGLILNAMGTEYFPRLSGVSHDSKAFNNTINQQIEICLLLIAPIIPIFIIFINLIIKLFYSSEFLSIEGMLYWIILTMFLRAPSWAIVFSLLAKGNTKLLLFNELIAKIYTISLDLIFYYNWGLTGLGISFMIGYILYLPQVVFVCKKKYFLTFDYSILSFFVIQLFLSIVCVLIINYTSDYKYLFGVIVIMISTYLSYRNLNKKINIKEILISKINDKFKSKKH
ncbi:MAG: oligosaccharide flippase family protein [Bacteroidales bacterium]|jgi:PST family polysaccharide transporter|nr:oligosaccharide flippase family protein [Bacteroidales bacterium]